MYANRCLHGVGVHPGTAPSLVLRTTNGRRSRATVAAPLLATVAPTLPLAQLQDLQADAPDIPDFTLRDVKSISYVSRRRLEEADFDAEEVDDEGLPLVYNEQRIAAFWSKRPGELAGRWTKFAGISAPWLTKLANAVITGRVEAQQGELARDAVDNLERLGPTFIKLGQIMSIRPDVLPPPVMVELAKLQDRIEPFDSKQAMATIEAELGAPIDTLFSEFTPQPIAAASLAQVYRARLRETGEEVAVKVQRPGALSTISKDLYVMRRAAGVYEQIVKRFTAQTTDYQSLLSTFAEGLYTEMDFRNEALNCQRMAELLAASEFASNEVVIPRPYLQYTTRRVMTMEWITGEKLTGLPKDEIRSLVKIGQEAFLTQLLEIGFFHGDPHPGNLLKVTEGPNAGKLALLDFGLVAEIPERDRAAMVSATIHLANRDWDALIDDFVELNFLARGCDRGLIIPVMERVLGPYLRGGGAKAFNFQALSQDLLAATLEIPFSVPPYMSLLARSVATLEGIALLGDPNYQMVTQAYPFVVRKVLRADNSASAALLRGIVYDADGNVKPTRLSALLNAALGYVASKTEGFVDFDAVPDDGATTQELIAFLLSPEARDLRPLLVNQLVNVADLFARDRLRKAYAALPSLVPRLPFIGALPVPPPPPLFVPGRGLMPAQQLVDSLAPQLSQQEGIYLQSLVQLVAGTLGVDPAELEEPGFNTLYRLVLSPTEQARELQAALGTASGGAASQAVVAEVAAQVVSQLMDLQAQRLGVPADTLFPMRGALLGGAPARRAGAPGPSTPAGGQSGSAPASRAGAASMSTSARAVGGGGMNGSSGGGRGGSGGQVASADLQMAGVRVAAMAGGEVGAGAAGGAPGVDMSAVGLASGGRTIVMRSLAL